MKHTLLGCVLLPAVVPAFRAGAQEALPAAAALEQASAETDLAKQLANPVANLISVPLQSNWDFGIGPNNAMRYTLNVQPVIPFSLTEDWSLITRTILPVICAESPADGVKDVFGLGDTVQSFFFSPKDTVGGWILGAGPAFLWPTATDELLGTEQWGAGPTAVALQQKGPWTYGGLANHIWSYAGDGDRGELNATFLNPFLSYISHFGDTLGAVGVTDSPALRPSLARRRVPG